MVSENPLAAFRLECKNSLADAIRKLFPKIQVARLAMETPPSPEFGQLASSLCFELGKQVGEKPFVLARRLVETMDKSKFSLIERVAAAGRGYINFHANFAKFSALTIDSARHFDAEYGFVKTENPSKIIVEHTSVNPIHPIHIGQARNPMLGDAIARLLRSRGHNVYRHYYVDDVGRQTAVIGYGHEKLGKPKPKGKPDHFIGKIYTITSCLVEINRLKRELERAKTASDTENITQISKELDSWMSVAVELKGKYPEFFEKLLEKINEEENPETMVNELNRAYEAGDEEARQLIREVSELCLEGFKETLSRAEVLYDSWDWESELVWSNRVEKILEKLQKTPICFHSRRRSGI